MAIGSGLSSQVGIGQEVTVGTAVTVNRFLEFDSESINYTKNTLQGVGLHAGGQYNRAARRVVSTVDAGGDLNLEMSWFNQLLLWKHALGVATGPTVVTGTAFKTVFTSGPLTGLGLTLQKGVPQTDGTVQPFTFSGGKVTGFKVSCSTSQIAMLNPTFNFFNVDTATALAAASYPAGNGVFSFKDATLKIGGTASTVGGITSISGGSNIVSLVNSFELDLSNPMKTDRYGLGHGGVKAEPIENDYRTPTGTLGSEFTSRAELWDLFKADTTTALQVTFVGPQIATTGSNYTVDIVLPAVKVDTGEISVGGPDVVPLSAGFTVLDDGTNNPVQVTITSTDSTL